MRSLIALLALLLIAVPAMAEERAPPETRVVIIHHRGPAWDASKPFLEQEGLQAHIDYYRGLVQSGKLAMGGPFLDDSGGMMVSQPGADLQTLTDFAQGDPAVKSGLLVAEIHPWMTAMKAP